MTPFGYLYIVRCCLREYIKKLSTVEGTFEAVTRVYQGFWRNLAKFVVSSSYHGHGENRFIVKYLICFWNQSKRTRNGLMEKLTLDKRYRVIPCSSSSITAVSASLRLAQQYRPSTLFHNTGKPLSRSLYVSCGIRPHNGGHRSQRSPCGSSPPSR